MGNVQQMVEEALRCKAHPLRSDAGKGLRLGLIFMNPSLRTRVSTQVAAQNLGMETIVLNHPFGG